MKTLYYILDSMCSWCYGFGPTWRLLLKALPKDINVVYVYGGLAPHSLEPMQEDMKLMLQGVWKQIERQVGVSFNHDFWTKCKPRRSTYLACQASIAARVQNKEYEMVQAIQQLYYQKASNPSDHDTLEEAAKNIDLDIQKFKNDLESDHIIELFQKDLEKVAKLGVRGFPSLVFEVNEGFYPIKIEYNNPETILDQIKRL